MTAIEEIVAERHRQLRQEGWSATHDDEHVDGSLATAAACYAAWEPIYGYSPLSGMHRYIEMWPWQDIDDKREKHTRRRRCIIAAALLVAEIQRLDREEVRGGT